MTRETKIGLVVAGSFLFLVAIVVGSKWRGGDPTWGDQEPQSVGIPVAAAKPTQNGADPNGKDGTGKGEKPPTPGTHKGEGKDAPKASFKLDVTPVPPPLNSSPNALTNEQTKNELQRLAAEANKQPAPNTFNGAQPVVGQGPMPVNPLDKKDTVFVPLVPAPTAGGFSADPMPKPGFPIEEKGSLLNAPPSPLLPGGVGTAENPQFSPLGKDPAPNSNLPPFAPINKEPTPIPSVPFGPINKEPTPTPIPSVPFGPINKEPTPTPIPSVPLGPISKDPAPSVPPFTPINKEPTPIPTVPPFAPISKDPAPTVPPFAPISKDPVPPFTPLNNNPAPSIGTNAIIPPIVVGNNNAKPSLPVVRDSNLEVHECRPGETNFAILSQRLYGSDKYAKALLAYNRAHSGAVKNGSNFSFDTPVLNPGQQVLHPPATDLRRDYRFFIAETAVPSIPSNVAPAPTIKLTPPSPLNPNIATVSTPSPAAAGRPYTVQSPNGESILDIAERVLGNRARWTDIYRLNQSNPSVQPQFRIPAGTELKMPAN